MGEQVQQAQVAGESTGLILEPTQAGMGTATPWVLGIVALGVLWTIFGGKE